MQQELLQNDVNAFKSQLRRHEVFNSIQTIDDLRVFSAFHIFLVWDYMSLVKSIQGATHAPRVPWVPSRTPYLDFLINTIALKEESDIGADGQYASHYEMYRHAMQHLRADMSLIDNLMQHVEDGLPIFTAIEISRIPGPLKDFLEYTFWVVEKAGLHEQAAVLCYGREGFGHRLLFDKLVQMAERYPAELAPFLYYLRRKNELNEKYHTELSRLMLRELCGADNQKWEEATAAAAQSLRYRLRLFDFIHRQMKQAAAHP